MIHFKKNRGITLVTLIITIVIMLILASVTIGAINGGLFEYAGKAKKDTEEVSKVTGIKESYILAKGTSKTGRINDQDMQNALDKIFGEDYAEALDNSGQIVVKIEDKYYDIDSKGNVGEGRTLEPIEYAGDITKGGQYNGNTKETAYRIECIEDLVALSKNVNSGNRYANKYVEVTKDLDFNSIFSYSDFTAKYKYDSTANAYIPDENSSTTIKELCTTGEGFIPIGFYNSFRGIFDGKNHEIKNMYINCNTGNVGLFGYIYNSTVKNVGLSGSINVGGYDIGGICGAAYSSTIDNCYNKANITTTKSIAAAGILAKGSDQNNIISNCYNTGDITTDGYAGGINGDAGFKLIYNCYNTGTIIGGNTYAGGIAGRGSVIKNCYNTGSVTAKYAAGIVGSITTALNCCSMGTINTNAVVCRNGTATNSFFKNGITSSSTITPVESATPFLIEATEQVPTTSDMVVSALNKYIDDNKTNADENLNTSEWLKWRKGADGLPELIFE